LPAAARFTEIVDAARNETGRARIGLINRAINLAIRPLRDSAQFGAPDIWQSPLMTFATGAGDCEDYAIAKYVALRQAGVTVDDLKIVIVNDARRGEDHAVTAARIDGEWLILDNRKMLLLADTQVRDLTPLIALGEDAPQPARIQDAGLGALIAATTTG
jgi:predicted transglutaminase-like cysteine proteinase